MLVCTRRVGDRIFIGDGIVLTISDIVRGDDEFPDKVRIALEVPKETPVTYARLDPPHDIAK